MGAKKLNLYESDYYSWIVKNVNLLKEKRFNDVDLANIIEELEDMGKREKKSLESYIINLISHRLKWDHNPNERSCRGVANINLSVRKVTKLIEENPSFKQLAKNIVKEAYMDGVFEAMSETGLPRDFFPTNCEYDLEGILTVCNKILYGL